MQPAKFTLDFLECQHFNGFTRGENWNGFACPYFTYDQAQDVVMAWQWKGCEAFYNSASDEFVFELTVAGGTKESDVFSGLEVEGKRLYPIGAFCWTWTEEEVL
jgi:hypothetical protein